MAKLSCPQKTRVSRNPMRSSLVPRHGLIVSSRVSTKLYSLFSLVHCKQTNLNIVFFFFIAINIRERMVTRTRCRGRSSRRMRWFRRSLWRMGWTWFLGWLVRRWYCSRSGGRLDCWRNSSNSSRCVRGKNCRHVCRRYCCRLIRW